MKLSRIVCAVLFLIFSLSVVFADIADILADHVPMPENTFPMYEMNIKAGFDFDGKYDVRENISGTGLKSFNTGNNLSFAAEYIRYYTHYVGIGGGISAQILRRLNDFPGKFGFAPAYLSLKVRSWPQEPGLYGYIFGHLGYNLFYGDFKLENNYDAKDGGLYYAAGIGMIYKYFLLEGMYSVNEGSAESAKSGRADIEYRKFTISAGYKL
ncbi:MAG: hypothetical protein LBL00_05255 [Endomicrobium sp.]|jgi:hypothetical protein|nr:hypothetical protein [Endomicrobium sp.]